MQFKGEEKNLAWVLRRGSPGETYSDCATGKQGSGGLGGPSFASAQCWRSEGPLAGGEGVLVTRENEAGSLNLDRGHELKAGGTGIVKSGNSKPWAPAASPGLPETLRTDV